MKENRMNKVNSEIQKHISEIIQNFDDLEFSSTIISVLKVETYADFSLSKIYISTLGGDEKKSEIVKKLNKNKKAIRYKLAHSMRFRTVPELLFIEDNFEEKSERVLNLFKQIEGENNNDW